ncbi:MAG TPA: hypothetical protein VL422_13155 [Miltoncostaea sp.]|nr:hypothetical protein [Miltoncostaea sp.]
MERGVAVVVGTSYRAGPWACRSLRAAGWRVVALHPVDDGRGRSTACLNPGRCPSATEDPEAFAEAVVARCREAGARVVLPLGEECVGAMALADADLGGALLVGPDAGQYSALCDKALLGITAGAAGVAHPLAATVTAEGLQGDWPPLPSVVKTREGVAPGALAPVVRVATSAERDRAVGALVDAGAEAVVEELVEAPQWTVHAVRGADGTFDAVTAEVVRTTPRGAGTPSVLRMGEQLGSVLDATRRLFEAIDFRGPGNAQFFVRDGRPLVHDVNLRLPASVALAMRAGLDMPARGVDAVLGLPLPPVPPPGPALGYVSVGDEVRMMLHGDGNGAGPGAGRVVRDIVRGAVAHGAMLDPPLRDPLWIATDLGTGAKNRARRVARRVRK